MISEVVRRGCVLGFFLLSASMARAEDWPQYRGPRNNGLSGETGIMTTWPADGPKVVWKIPVGEAFGSFAISGQKALLYAEQEGKEACFAYDAATGKQLWATPIDTTIFEKQGGNGPRSTPTIEGNRVYVLGTYLKLACLDLADGKVLWLHDLVKEFNGQRDVGGIGQWGSAASPLVEGKLVIVAGGGAGQSLMAFDKESGAVVWKGLAENITHATGTPATIHGVRQVIFFTQSGLVSVKPESGAVLWQFKFPFKVSTAASPVVNDDTVYCSAAYGVGAGAYRIIKEGDQLTAKEIWRTPGELMNHWSTPVFHNGYVFGIYGHGQHGTAPLKCVELATGKEMWSQNGFGPGGTILVNGYVMVTGDKGQLVLVEATPKGYNEVARAQPLVGKCWTMPVISNGRVFMRTTKEAVCLDLRKELSASAK